MINRHPHIFKNQEIVTQKKLLVNWDEIKKEEKGFETLY